MPEALDGVLLVGPQRPTVLGEVDPVGLTVHVAGLVLGRPAHLEQLLLEVATLGGVHEHAVLVDAGADQGLDLPVPQDLLEHRPVGRAQQEAVLVVLLQGQPAVAVHRLGDVDEQRVRHGVPAVRDERVDHLLGVMTGRPGVPQPERGDAVGVHVLGRPLELGEGGDGPARLLGTRVVDLEQEGLVALDDQGAIGHAVSTPWWMTSTR